MGINLLDVYYKKIIIRSLFIFLCLLTVLLSSFVKADWSGTFPQGVNNYDVSGTITFNTSYLYNAPNNATFWYSYLPTYKYIQDGYSLDQLCVTSSNSYRWCQAGNYVANLPISRIDFAQCTSSSTVNVGPPTWDNKQIDIVEGEYNNILLEGGSDKILRFTSKDGIYKIKSLTATSGQIVLSAGQYWIESLSINHGVTLIYPSVGTVSLFIKDDYKHYSLNTVGQPEKLLIYNYGNFTLNGGGHL